MHTLSTCNEVQSFDTTIIVTSIAATIVSLSSSLSLSRLWVKGLSKGEGEG